MRRLAHRDDVPGPAARRRRSRPPRSRARPIPAMWRCLRALGKGDITARFVIVALFSIMVFRLGSDFLQTGRIAGLLLLASEGLVVILTVFRRPAGAVDRSVKARTLMVISLIGPILVSPASASVPHTAAGIRDRGDFGLRSARGHRRQSLARTQLRPDAGEPRCRLDRRVPARPAPDLHGLSHLARCLLRGEPDASATC